MIPPHLLRLLLLPFLRRETLGRPGVNRGDLVLQGRVHEPMSREAGLLLKQGRHDHRLEHLAASAYFL